MKKVLVIQRALHQYQVETLNMLRDALKKNNVELSFIYGKAKNKASLKQDQVDISWGIPLNSKLFKIGKREMVWQPVIPYLKDKDLVIIEQANRNLINYYLFLNRDLKNNKMKVAYWGHGRNLQANEKSIGNLFKSLFINKADWFFAYTKKVKEHLITEKFPAEKITVLQNAINTKPLQEKYEKVKEEEITDLKIQMRIDSSNIGIYCGAIYKEKRLEYLIEAADKIKEKILDFHLIVIGTGPDAHVVEEAVKTRPWLHHIGPKFGEDRVIYFKMSKVFVMPGAIGLAILDAFAMQTPMITTDFPYHGPEYEYLEHEKNGIVTPDNFDAFVKGTIALLKDNKKIQRLKEDCKITAKKYTLETMVSNYEEGILKCLNIKPVPATKDKKLREFETETI